jgi:hypothetical protein
MLLYVGVTAGCVLMCNGSDGVLCCGAQRGRAVAGCSALLADSGGSGRARGACR